MIKLIVFDMAGTVVNENNAVYKTLQKAINGGGIDVTLDQVLAEGAGKEKSKAIQDIINRFDPGHPPEEIEKMYQHFLVMLEKVYEHLEVTPIDGAEELFKELKTRRIYSALNTGYNHKTAYQLLSKLGWVKGITVDEVVTASDVVGTRPRPDMIFHAMKLTGVSEPKEVLKIGDSIIDIEEGKNAGCGLTVGITTGAHTLAQLESAYPDYVINHLSELLALAI
jgi:phosphonatase-like hydrolase